MDFKSAGSAKRVLFATEDWKVEQPILEFSAIVDLKYNNPALATNDQIKIIDLFKERIDTLQQQFAHYEQIKRFTLLPHPFSMERGLSLIHI